MYLKYVEIDGFKSFADKVKLNFDMGITSIVGPNGSGKSNILDAILWVLGEQSYKNIRAKNSSDVIFSGGKDKKPRTTATVSLYIDNEDNALDIEDDIIKVTRKINKKSENEYYINDKKCRLKDINELFLDTGVGKSAYSVIGQGKVEKIIGASNKEIKSIIEEAAGIKKIKLRKDEAIKKLSKVEFETEKINLIIGELKESKEKVGKQAEKAIKYKKLDNEIGILKKSIYFKEAKEKKVILENLSKEKENLNDILKNLESNFETQENTLEELNTKRAKLNIEIDNLTDKNIDLKKDIDKLVNNKTLYSERAKGFSREITNKKERLVKIEDKIEMEIKELHSLENKRELILEELESLEKDNIAFSSELEKLEKDKNKLEVEVNIQKDHIMDSEVGRLKLIAEIENSEKRTKSSENKIKELEEELGEYEAKTLVYNQKLENSQNKKDKLQLEIEEIDKTITNSEEKIEEINNKINTCYESRKEVAYNLSRHSAKLENLKKLDANNEGFFKGVKSILNANIDGVDGAFIDIIEIPEYLEMSIESGVGGLLQDIVVRDNIVAKKCINYLKETKGGRASFLAFDSVKTNTNNQNTIKKQGEVLGYAKELVSYNPIYEKIVEFVMGNLLVVKSIDEALKISKSNIHKGNIVTLKGEIISKRGRLTGGQHIKSASSIIFERKKEIKKLIKIVEDLESKHKILDTEYEKMSNQMENYEKQLENIDDNKLNKENQLRALTRILEEDEDRLKKEKKKLRIISLEIEEEKNYISGYEKQVQDATKERFDIEEFLNNSKNKLESTTLKLTTIKTEIDSINKSYSNIKINYMNKKENTKQLQREIDRNKLSLDNLTEEKSNLIKETNILNSDIKVLEEKLEDIEKSYFNENNRYKKEFIEIKEKKKEQEHLELLEKQEILNVKNTEKEIIQNENKIKITIEKLEKTNGALLQLDEKLEKLETIETRELEFDIKKSNEILSRLEVKLENLGTVNLLAIKEFEELTEKYNFITSQRDDLILSKKSLLKLIEDIEKIIETQFYTAYKEIDKNFEHMCKEILNNSEGKLKLINKENIAESGIDLLVKFKNKKSQSITLLSGGEKSMVAIAFIMALFMYKPSPFTFFDEIEAALDETNIKKLIEKLKEFTDRSQFVLITHNKETMRRSDTLYGVTMNKELGESKIISVSM